jgi:hypothetical protein
LFCRPLCALPLALYMYCLSFFDLHIYKLVLYIHVNFHIYKLVLYSNDPKINRILPRPQGNHVAKFGQDPIYRTKVIMRKRPSYSREFSYLQTCFIYSCEFSYLQTCLIYSCEFSYLQTCFMYSCEFSYLQTCFMYSCEFSYLQTCLIYSCEISEELLILPTC